MPPEKRNVTIIDVARLAGVSTATAARGLGQYGSVGAETRQRILAAADRLGYSRNELASSLITGRTSSLGLVVGDIENPFFSTLARAAIDAARRHGYQMLVANSDEVLDSERDAVRVLQEKRVDGLVLAPVSPADTEHLQRLVASGTPLVLVDGYRKGLDVDSVIGDNRTGAMEAVRVLLDAGHRDIALITRSATALAGAANPHVTRSGSERVDGYRAALRKAGIQPNPSHQRLGGLRVEDAALAMQALLDLPRRPTAVLTTNSVIMLGVLAALNANGLRVPDDMSLINFDDPSWAEHMSPALTTVVQPTRAIGELAVELLIRRLTGDAPAPKIHRLPTTLQLRSSVAAPAHPTADPPFHDERFRK